jgi:hypothetical protein
MTEWVLACWKPMSRDAPKDAATVMFCGQFGVKAARSWWYGFQSWEPGRYLCS